MLEFLEQYKIIIVALTGSLGGTILGLVVSHLRRDKFILGYDIITVNIVKNNHAKLSMTYENQKIDKLDSHTIQLRNVGNKVLKNLPVRIDCKDSQIVSFDAKGPSGEEIEIENQGNALIVNFALLNPSESISVDITVADAQSDQVTVSARGEYLKLKSLSMSESNKELIQVLFDMLPYSDLINYKIFLGRMKR